MKLLTERIIEALILCAICVISILGNVSLWIIVLRNRTLRTAANALLLCLSTADLLVSVLSMPLTIATLFLGGWKFHDGTCVLAGFLTMCTFITSVMSLGVISISRYILVCHPQKYNQVYNKRNTTLIILGACLFSMGLGTPPLLGWGRYGYLASQSFCFCEWKTSRSYTFFMVGVCFGGPCGVMSFCYANILKVFRASKKRISPTVDKSQNCDIQASRIYVTPAQNGSLQNSPTAPLQNATKPNIGSVGIFLKKNGTGKSPDENSDSFEKFIDLKAQTSSMSARGEKITETTEKQRHGDLLNPSDFSADLERSTDTTTRKNERAKLQKQTFEKEKRKRLEERKLTLSFLIMILSFIICWLPFCITMFISVYSTTPVPHGVDMFTLLLGYLNSALNPVIYGVLNKKFRDGFRNIYCRLCFKLFRNTSVSNTVIQ